jgi:ribosomal protein S4
LFFGFKKIKKFLWLWNKNKKHLNQNYYKFNDFLFILESRLEIFLLRLNFFNSIYFIKQFIISKNIFINNMRVFRPDFHLKIFDIVNINYKYFNWLFKNIKYKLNKFSIFLNIPKYIEIDWALLTSILIKKPSILELNKPYKINNILFL